MVNKFARFIRFVFLFILLSSMTGCLYWVRAYRTYLQMDEFDEHFAITVKDDFTVHFKDPILYSDDFVSLAKLKPSSMIGHAGGQSWRYIFQKVDEQGRIFVPEVKFFFDLDFNQEDRIFAWTFSPLFLQIAPPEFLELSFRSIGSGEINQEKKQLHIDTDKVAKIDTALPLKPVILEKLGEPLQVDLEDGREVLLYHFKLQTPEIKAGYENRGLSEVRLYFDQSTQELVKMSGSFAGLKLAIDYRKYQQREQGSI